MVPCHMVDTSACVTPSSFMPLTFSGLKSDEERTKFEVLKKEKNRLAETVYGVVLNSDKVNRMKKVSRKVHFRQQEIAHVSSDVKELLVIWLWLKHSLFWKYMATRDSSVLA